MPSRVKQIVLVVVLLLIVVAVAVHAVKKTEIGGVKMPKKFTGRPFERVDIETGELMTISVGEWHKLGRNGWKFKHPKSGKYTMVEPIICRSCGAKIPPVDMPEPDGANEAASLAYSEATRSYPCPQCGGRAY